MAKPERFPRHLVLAGAATCGVLLALAVHMLGQSLGLNLGGLWQTDRPITAGAAIAWWLVSAAGFVGGYVTASLVDSAGTGQLPPRLRQFFVVVIVLVLAAAGQAASAPSAIPTVAGVVSGLCALILGGVVAFFGAHFALRKT